MATRQSPAHRLWVMAAVDQYEQRLVRFAMRLLGSEEAARDVVQHAFLQLCQQQAEKIDDYLDRWLFTAVRNRAMDVLRRQRREPSSNGEVTTDAACHDCDPAEIIEQQELGEILLGLVDTLPTAQRECVLLWAEGWSGVEIAKITQRSDSTVRVHLHKAFRTLREHPRVREMEGVVS